MRFGKLEAGVADRQSRARRRRRQRRGEFLVSGDCGFLARCALPVVLYHQIHDLHEMFTNLPHTYRLDATVSTLE